MSLRAGKCYGIGTFSAWLHRKTCPLFDICGIPRRSVRTFLFGKYIRWFSGDCQESALFLKPVLLLPGRQAGIQGWGSRLDAWYYYLVTALVSFYTTDTFLQIPAARCSRPAAVFPVRRCTSIGMSSVSSSVPASSSQSSCHKMKQL